MDEQAGGLQARGDVGEAVRDRLEVLERLPNACRAAAWSRRRRRAPPAPMPTANAPTLGRKRSSVRIATRKPRSTSPRTCSGGHGHVRRRRAGRSGAGRRSSIGSPVSPGESRGTANAVTPRAPAPSRRAGEHRVDVGVRRVGDVDLLAGQPVAVAVGARPPARARRRRCPAPGSVSAKPATASPVASRGTHVGDRVRVARLQQGERAQPLHGERGLRLGAVAREPLADQAQLHRADVRAPALVVELVEPVEQAGSRRSSRTSGRFSCARRRPRAPAAPALAGRGRRRLQQLELPGLQVGVEQGSRHRDDGGHPASSASTASAMSSTSASSSNSRVTPNSPIAG